MRPHAISSEEWWDRLAFEYQDAATDLNTLSLEPAPSKKLKRLRTSIRRSDNKDTLITYSPTDDRDELSSYLKAAKEIARELEPLFKLRRATPEFLQRWGAFQFAYGVVMHGHFAGQPDRGRRRAGVAGGKKVSDPAHTWKRWVAHQLLQRMDAGRMRHSAEKDVALSIRVLIKGNKFPQGFGKSWFQSLLNKDGLLRDAYTRKRLPEQIMRQLIRESRSGIPPDISIP